ncbi:SRPBCC family protein [Brevibacillus fluminis]|uniref:SRPBCC family protein n=1 Tax=Brevibacillus fluminis TaxID=511487 RepID=UPI003F89AD99
MEQKVTGQTKSVGFQIGVRRTFPIPADRAWELVTTGEVADMWLGTSGKIMLEPGATFGTDAGVNGQLRIVKPQQQLRLSWQKAQWDKPSTLQIRFLAAKGEKTTISFHQEHLANAAVREEMRMHWEQVAAAIKEKIEREQNG